MTEKVRVGLGLVVVALIAWLVSLPLSGADNGAATLFGNLFALIAIVCGIIGLVFVAVGLLGRQETR